MKLYIKGYSRKTHAPYRHVAHFVYAHGHLYALSEELHGRDIVEYNIDDTFDFKQDRVEDIIAVLPNGREIEATLFFWHGKARNEMEKEMMKEQPVYKCHGLLVAKDDETAIRYAAQAYEKQQGWA